MKHLLNDASLLANLAGRTADINIQVMEEPLVGITYPDIVPVNTSYQDWQLEAGSGVWRTSGEADWLTGKSDDVPKVGLDADTKFYGFSAYGVGYDWDYEEIGKAAAYGVGTLTTMKAGAARRKSEEFAQKIAIIGDARKGYNGIINQAGVTPINAATQWRSATALTATLEQILMDIAVLIDGPITNVIDPLFVRADTLAVDQLTYRLLQSTYAASITTGTDMGLRMVADVIRERYGIEIVVIPELATAAATPAGGARAIGYARRQDVIELPVAFAYRFEQGYQAGPFKFNVPGWGRMGGVQLHNAGGLRYLDNVGPA